MEYESPKFDSTLDVSGHLDMNPHLLVGYVEMGIAKDVCVLATHIAQLANKVGIPLKASGRTFMNLERVFMRPTNFANIREVIHQGRHMFPEPRLRH